MTRIGVIGQGAIARTLVPLLVAEGMAVTVLARPGRRAAALDLGVDVVEELAAILDQGPELVVEAAGQGALAMHGGAVLHAGVDLIAASVGALCDDGLRSALLAAARAGHARLHLPSGAIGGLDALAALSNAGPVELCYTGTKPPKAWPGAPEGVFFEGTARQAATQYPKNANVAAALALAGPGLDATAVRLVSDPAATENTHSWEAHSAAGSISMTIRNTPTAGNAATSVLTVHSLFRTVMNLTREWAV